MNASISFRFLMSFITLILWQIKMLSPLKSKDNEFPDRVCQFLFLPTCTKGNWKPPIHGRFRKPHQNVSGTCSQRENKQSHSRIGGKVISNISHWSSNHWSYCWNSEQQSIHLTKIELCFPKCLRTHLISLWSNLPLHENL